MSAVATRAPRALTESRLRVLCAGSAAAAAAVMWAIEVPLLGVRLSIRFGAMRPETVIVGQVVGAAVVAALLGWLLLAMLERRTPRARTVWTGAALLVLFASLAMPLVAATTTSAAVGLIALHLTVGAVVIPGMTYRRPVRGRLR